MIFFLLVPTLAMAANHNTLTAKNMQSLVQGLVPQLTQCSTLQDKPVVTKKLKNKTDESINGKKITEMLINALKQKASVEFVSEPPATGGHFDLLLELSSSKLEKNGRTTAEYTLVATLKEGTEEQCQVSAGIQKTGTTRRK